MNFRRIDFPSFKAWAQVATYSPNAGVAEHHVMLHIAAQQGKFAAQFNLLEQAYLLLLQQFINTQVVMRRYFLSDIANQAPLLKERLQQDGQAQGAISIIGQPPLDGSKIALWIYLAEGLEVSQGCDITTASHNGYRHHWTTNWQSTNGDSNSQAREILENYEAQLQQQGLNIADHCLRTWFYIRDVDSNYKGMVVARRNNFTQQNLTPDTHFIASTGIGGLPITTQSRVQMDGYAAEGVSREQQQYLYAPTHLNPTYQYGVTFERGTAIQYGDRRHVLISGTASINNRGEVVHVGDVEAQADRMLENISKLLEEGGATLNDVTEAVIYLRDVADYETVKQIIEARLPQMPHVITLAPVCRPAWLIEMECIAIVPEGDTRYRNF